MPYCERLSEQLAIVATIDPIAATATGALTSDVFSMALHRRAMFIFKSGAVFGTVDLEVQEATASGGVYQNLIATASATATASQFIFEVSAAALSTGYLWLRGRINGIAIGDVFDVTVLADVERYHPASDRDLASVVSILATA